MTPPPTPDDESARLEALRLYDVLDTPPEEPFDDLTELAAHICEAPIALISLIDEDRQWFKSRVGLDAVETARNISFCGHAILQPDVFVVEDASRDPRFADNPLVTGEPRIRFYAGAPLVTAEGAALGTLCVIDREARQLSPDHRRALRVLSRHVIAQLELRRARREAAQSARDRDDYDRRLALADESRRTLLSVLEDQQAAERALREQETFFRLIAEGIGDLVAVLDLEGRRLYNSPSYRRLFADLGALRGTDSFAEIHPDDREEVRRIFAETIRTGQGQRAAFRFLLADGSVRNMESQGGVIWAADGTVEKVVVVSRDVTERRRMEDEIRKLNADLELRVRERTAELAAANKELETFTYSVSHDLKAPLRGIDGYSRLLIEHHAASLDEEGRLFLANVRHGVDQMNELIEDLLAYSRIERRSLGAQRLPLVERIEALLDERREELRDRSVEVELALGDLTVEADPEGLALVLRNLIDNALKFSRDSRPPRLVIRAMPGEKSTILEIKDNGIGFDMQFHDRIFEIFQRLQRAEDYPGTGVGLAIVHKAVERMGGRVWAESEPGRGASFFLELPRS